MSKPTHTLGSDWSFDKITQEVTDEHGDMVAIIQWLSSPEIGGIFAAAPDMLEVLELEESLIYYPRGTRIPVQLETLWGQRFCEEFERGEPSLINDLYSLAIRLRRRAIAKAKGEAE